jgi:FAD/FMN-containing dehydrogenase
VTTLKSKFLEDVVAIVSPNGLLVEEQDVAPFFTDWRRRWKAEALGVAFPKTTAQVAELVRLCAMNKVAVVPQGGNTGLVGGAIPPKTQASLIVNLSKMNKIRQIDALNNSMTVEAGCVLATVREAADTVQRQFPLLLGSVGSCEIGGLVATNAGGTGVLRYGNMRDLVLGLEVVLPDGRIWSGLKSLRKDNTGYDLKHLFIGSEGSLGIITAASLKLFPKLRTSGTAMVALSNVENAIKLLRLFQERLGNCVEAFELMSLEQIQVVSEHPAGRRSPMPLDSPWYVMIELADSAESWSPASGFEKVLEEAFAESLVEDAVIAQSESQAQKIWELRHSTSESNVHAGFSIPTDTSVPVSALPEFLRKVTARLKEEITACRVVHCGHVGDGNIHVVAILDRQLYGSTAVREAAAAKVNSIAYATAALFDGSISAEHGIGFCHVEDLENFKPDVDIDLMQLIKAGIDPLNLMNPGKVLAASASGPGTAHPS